MKVSNYYYHYYYFEGVCGRATNVILARSAGCKGFARRSVTSVPARIAAQSRANYRKVAEFQDQAYSSYVVPEFRVLAAKNWPTLRDLSCPEKQKRFLWVRETRRSKRETSLWIRETKKETLDR